MSLAAHWRARVWAAQRGVLALSAVGASHRSVLDLGSVTGVDLGVPHPWGVRISAGASLPTEADASAALAWCRERGAANGWRVSVPSRLARQGPWAGLVAHDQNGVFAMEATTAAGIRVDPPDRLDLVTDPSIRAVVAGYGGWMSDLPLARLLVTPADLDRPDRRFVVGIVDGRPVGCAFVCWATGTAYLSGIGVLPGQRGRGYGRALTAAAVRLAVTGPLDDRRPKPPHRPAIVWLLATDASAGLYARMGFERIDTEALLGPGSQPPETDRVI